MFSTSGEVFSNLHHSNVGRRAVNIAEIDQDNHQITMDLCRICEQEFLRFCNFGNLHRHWKTDRLHTYTICDREFTRVGNLRRHKTIVHYLPHPLTRGRKPRQPIRRSSSDDLDDSTVMEPWSLTPTSVEKKHQSYYGAES